MLLFACEGIVPSSTDVVTSKKQRSWLRTSDVEDSDDGDPQYEPPKKSKKLESEDNESDLEKPVRKP